MENQNITQASKLLEEIAGLDKKAIMRAYRNKHDKEMHKVYLLKNPKKPYVKKRDGKLKGKEAWKFVPEELQGQISQEQYEELMDTTVDSCEIFYHKLKEAIDSPDKALRQVLSKDNTQFLPYLPEVEKFKTIVSMVSEDRIALHKELDSIRKLYEVFLGVDGKAKKDLPERDAYITEKVLDVKLRLFVCGQRIRNVFEPVVKHISDFYSSMKFAYYMQHKDEAPEDIRKFLDERMANYTNTQIKQEQVSA